jgi:NucS shadow ORF
MSLDVSPQLLAQAQAGPVDPAAFLDTVRTSLPYAYDLIASLAKELDAADPARPFADNQTPPPSEAARGQLLRALASDAIRSSLEEHFGVKLAFQNCHRVAVFRTADAGTTTHRDFTSQRSQLLNQSPELRDC